MRWEKYTDTDFTPGYSYITYNTSDRNIHCSITRGVTTVAKAKSDGADKKPSQMGMVRAALLDMGGDPKPLEMQAHIKGKFGVELPANIISNYKSQLKRKAGGTPAPGRGRRSGTLQVADFETVRGLVKRLGAEQVRKLVEVCE